MTVKEIVEKHLQENGYDGLYYPEECGCKVGNLMPCIAFGGSQAGCLPGYLQQIDDNNLEIKKSEDAERNFTIGGKKMEEF